MANNEEIKDKLNEEAEVIIENEEAEATINEEAQDENIEQEVLEDIEEDSEENTLVSLKKLKDENKKLNNELEAMKDRILRLSAEYENYRKRTSKEKESIYTDACVDVLSQIIPVVDNLERALIADGSVDDLKKGIEMTIKGVQTSLEKLGIEEIDASGEFDPNLHQAVMHIQDDNFGKNIVAEVFLKGYKRGDKVIRYTMVKVAN